MSVTIQIPTALKRFAGSQDAIELAGDSVAQLMAHLKDEHPELGKHLFNADGSLRNFVNVYVNDEDIRYLQQLRTPLSNGDVVTIVPAVAGG